MSKNTTRGQIRNDLLAAGYRPIPLLSNGKGTHIKGWSRAEVTPEWLKPFERKTNYANTGIRCDDLAAFDLDIPDEELCDAAEAIIEQMCGETELCRIGRAPKRLLLYRVSGEKPFRKARTAKYEPDLRAELLSGYGCQFAAFGMHPSGKEYEWLGVSPLDVPYDDLPEVEYHAAIEALNAVQDMLRDTGREEVKPQHIYGPGGGGQLFDLTDDFECLIAGDIITWGELKGQLTLEGEFGNIKREDGDFGDSNAVHFYLTHGSEQPAIHDFTRDSTHYDEVGNPALAAVLPPLAPVFTDPIQGLLDTCVMIMDGTVRYVEDPLRGYDLTRFHQLHEHMTVPNPNPGRGKPMELPATKVWVKHPNTMRARYAQLRPDEPGATLVEDGKATVFNTYNPPEHDAAGGEIATVREFVRHLVPDKRERGLFWDWHAFKAVQPSARMHGLMMVADRIYGTGRGTWTQICQKVFGINYVNEIPLKQLIGTGGQSEFNEYMGNSLIVSVPEALEEKEDSHRWQTRHVAYEQLKLVCDTVASRIQVRRKYGKNSIERCYASILIASNHTDALAIEPGDRRLMVLDNGRTPLPDAPDNLYDRIQEWQTVPANIAALHGMLIKRAAAGIKYDPFGKPPETTAKNRMIEEGQSDTDKLFEAFQDEAPGDICTLTQWRAYARAAQFGGDFDLPSGDLLEKALTAVITRRGRRIESLGGGQMKVKGRPVRPWIIRNFDKWEHAESLDGTRAEILKNGDPGASVHAFPPQKPK